MGVGHTTTVDVGTVGDVRKRTNSPVKRRALQSRKSHCIDEIRKIMGMRDRTPKVEILNAGAGIWSVAVIGSAVDHVFFLAIRRLGGVVPQSASGNNVEEMKLAYEALHECTGSQGRLRHVQCLVLGEWSSLPSLPVSPIPADCTLSQAIRALRGEPTLNPIFVGQPSGSTRA